MATDSTELTFVRCPSCRSLVPAVSTRCRMCGAGLDASGEGEDAEKDQKKSGRVRQRTMSQAQSELNAAVSKLRASEGSTAPAPAAPVAPVMAAAPVEPPAPAQPVQQARIIPEMNLTADSSLDDPLSAYIEEVEEPEPAAQAAEKPSVERNGSAAHKAPEQSIPAAHIISQRSTLSPEPAAAPAKSEAPAKSAAPEREELSTAEEPSQRVIVESGLRRHGKPSGLSFSKGREEQQQEPQKEAPKQQAKAPQHEQKQEQRQEPKHEHKHEQRHEVKNDQRDRGSDRHDRAERHDRSERQERAESITFTRDDRQTRQRDQERPQQQQRQREEPRREQEPRREPERHERPTAVQARPSEDVRKGEAAPGRLFGWLVSYSDPDGAATELREGKFFVTASSLKQTDLIIEDPTISTPHALVSVGIESGLRVQDLMSDRGIFVRRRGDDTYRREADVVNVEHGDWLRFGDVEYLVSLIAHVGVK